MSIAIREITKQYGQGKDLNTALQSVTFEVEKGTLFGLIGPDGAGKTTLFRILTTLLLADEGSAEVAGLDVVKDYKRIRKAVGYMPGKFALYQDLTVLENLHLFATLYHTTIEENYDLVKEIYEQIKPFENRRAGALSGGMKQKLALCCALIHKPEVLFLDEPTTGVDAVSRKEFWEMLQRLKAQDITILVSTPYMDEANLCDRIALIQEGKILSINTPRDLIHDFAQDLWGVQAADMYRALKDIENYAAVKSCYTFGAEHHVQVKDMQMPDDLQSFLLHHNHTNIVIEKIEPTIEDCFMELMNQ